MNTKEFFDYYRKAKYYKINNNYEKSEYYYNKTILLDRNSSLFLENLKIIQNCFYDLSEIYYKQRNFNKVIPLCDKAINFFSDNSEFLFIKGFSLYKIKEYIKSIETLEKIDFSQIKEDKQYKINNLLVSCYSITNNFKKAEYYLNQSIKINKSKSILEIQNYLQHIQKKQNPELSICMITKNSEKYIEDCLNSIKDLGNEIIITDTGSTDNTIEISKQYTDKIFSFEWKNNFSKAKNFTLKKATKDWILFIDSDQILKVKNLEELYSVLRDPFKIGVYINVIVNNLQMKSLRLFRNKLGIYYKGSIHEQINNSIQELLNIYNEYTISELPINLIEQSYKSDDEMKTRQERNYLMLKDILIKNNLDLHERLYYLIKLSENTFSNKPEESIEYLQKAHEIINNLTLNQITKIPVIAVFYNLITNYYLQKQNFLIAEKVCNESIKIFPNEIKLLENKANILKLNGKINDSKLIYKKISQIINNKNFHQLIPINIRETMNKTNTFK